MKREKNMSMDWLKEMIEFPMKTSPDFIISNRNPTSDDAKYTPPHAIWFNNGTGEKFFWSGSMKWQWVTMGFAKNHEEIEKISTED